MDQLAALASWNEALGMDLRETHREVNRIRCKVEIDEVTIGRVRGALWQGKEVGSEEDMSISMVDAEIDGEVPSPQNSPRRFHLLFLCRRRPVDRIMLRLQRAHSMFLYAKWFLEALATMDWLVVRAARC